MQARQIEQLAEWVRIRSVAGVPELEVQLARSANWLAGTLRAAGWPTVEVWPHHAVHAEWPGPPGSPTVLVYSHHDVRAVKDDEWQQCAPFEPVVRDGRLYGRGASDAKGQVLAHLWALEALGTPPLTVRLLVEGEEETGSPHLASLLDDHRDRLAADLVVVSDTMTWSAERPAVRTGNRGMIKAELEVHGPGRDLHAGAVSGVAPNPATELTRLLGKLHDAAGRVAVPGFYDDVAPVPDEERAALAELTADAQAWVERTGTRAVVGEEGCSIGERLYLRPAAEVGALASGDADPPSRGVIAAGAMGQIQFALVPHQDPGKIADLVRAWVAAELPDHVGYDLEVGEEIAQPAYATPRDHPALPLLHEAMSEAWGVRAGWMRNAGAGPGVLLSEATGAPVAYFGTGLPEDNWHGPDESVDLAVLEKGVRTLTLWWPRLAEALEGTAR